MAPNNSLPIWGNEKTMNLNSMILTNVQSSPYFKVNLFGLKTYHEVIDEIYYKVNHLEPWEKGSRKTAGQTGMCGGVRGVGAGGIVSTAYCILYKLYTLKLTRKQVIGLMTHTDSPYIRALGFMYIRYTQPPADLWEWYEPYLADEEEVDVKAGGGHVMMIGEILQQWLTKLEWYSTLFPRIPVPVQKTIDTNLKQWLQDNQPDQPGYSRNAKEKDIPEEGSGFGEAERMSQRERSPGRSAEPRHMARRSTPPFDIAKAIEQEKGRQRYRSRSKERRSRSRDRRSRSRERHRRSRSRDRHRKHSPPRSRHRSRSRERRRDRSRERRRSRDRRSRSRDRHRRHKSRSRSRERRSRDRRRSRSKEHRRSHSTERGKRQAREDSFERDLKSLKKHISRQKENGK